MNAIAAMNDFVLLMIAMNDINAFPGYKWHEVCVCYECYCDIYFWYEYYCKGYLWYE